LFILPFYDAAFRFRPASYVALLSFAFPGSWRALQPVAVDTFSISGFQLLPVLIAVASTLLAGICDVTHVRLSVGLFDCAIDQKAISAQVNDSNS
jgi:hypothetical protein